MHSTAGIAQAPGGVTTVGRPARRSALARMKRALPWYLFIAPNIVAFLVFQLFTWGFLIFLSFHDWNLLGVRTFNGLDNYSRMLSDRVLVRALVNTLEYTLMFVLPMAAVSLALAVSVNQGLRGMYLFRGIYYLPVVTSIAVIALIWKFILLPQPSGILNYVLGLAGIPAHEWLLSTTLAMPAITAMSIWSGMGYYMVLWLAGLQGVPVELYEAARIDGAGGWQSFRYVTLPVLKPTTIFIIMISTIGAFQVFGPQYMLTGGGPVRATTSIVYYIWQQAFSLYRIGYSSSISLLLFVIILIASLIQRRYMGWSETLF
jgi:multiple sugar transport system permease protein